MGKLVVWWSMYHGQNKTTASMLSIALALADKQTSVCVTHTQLGMADLEGMMNYRAAEEDIGNIYVASGLNALLLDFKGGIINKQAIERATFQPDRGKRLYMLPGIEYRKMGSLGEDEDIIARILSDEVKNAYDYLFVELSSGANNTLTSKLIAAADVAVVCVSQNAARLKEYFDNPLEQRFDIDKSKVLICFGGYRSNGKINYKNVNSKRKVPCIVVPDSNNLLNAISEGDVHGYFIENELCDEDEDGYFMEKVREGAKILKSFA